MENFGKISVVWLKKRNKQLFGFKHFWSSLSLKKELWIRYCIEVIGITIYEWPKCDLWLGIGRAQICDSSNSDLNPKILY